MVQGQFTILGSRTNPNDDDYKYQVDVNPSGALITSEYGAVPTETVNSAYDFTWITSGTSTGIKTGSKVGTIRQIIGAGSYDMAFSYVDNNIDTISSWVEV